MKIPTSRFVQKRISLLPLPSQRAIRQTSRPSFVKSNDNEKKSTATTLDDNGSTTTTPTMWFCDKCHVASFRSHDEALAHETNCVSLKSESTTTKTTSSVTGILRSKNNNNNGAIITATSYKTRPSAKEMTRHCLKTLKKKRKSLKKAMSSTWSGRKSSTHSISSTIKEEDENDEEDTMTLSTFGNTTNMYSSTNNVSKTDNDFFVHRPNGRRQGHCSELFQHLASYAFGDEEEEDDHFDDTIKISNHLQIVKEEQEPIEDNYPQESPFKIRSALSILPELERKETTTTRQVVVSMEDDKCPQNPPPAAPSLPRTPTGLERRVTAAAIAQSLNIRFDFDDIFHENDFDNRRDDVISLTYPDDIRQRTDPEYYDDEWNMNDIYPAESNDEEEGKTVVTYHSHVVGIRSIPDYYGTYVCHSVKRFFMNLKRSGVFDSSLSSSSSSSSLTTPEIL